MRYERTPSITTIDEGRDAAYEAETLFGGLMPGRNGRGDVEAGLAAAAVRVDVAYRFAANHHNPIETSATTAVWDGGRLTLYDSTMGIRATQLTVAHLLGMHLSDIRVLDPVRRRRVRLKAMIWPHVTLAAMAARHVGRPVRLVLTRPQMFTSNGHREEQEQRVSLGADADGRLTAIRHQKLSVTSPFDDWAEPATGVSPGVRVPELRGRAPPDPGQHDDADVHPRPRRVGRRVRPGERDGRAGVPPRGGPGRTAGA